jgi:hypothetical protein
MARSSESLERRRAYTRAWSASPAGRAYHRRWRQEHPEIEKARRDRWRAANPDRVRAQRETENERRRARRAAELESPIPAPATGHPLFEAAARIVPVAGRGGVVSFWDEELEYDLRSEAVLAMLDGRDPIEAIRTYRSRERRWRHLAGWAGPLLTGEFGDEAAA